MLVQPSPIEYGLIGKRLIHSFSMNYFNQKFESEHINARYINFELPDIGDLMEMLSEHPDLHGFNVTIPYKEQIIPYLDDIDDDARQIGAVNVVKVLNPGDSQFILKGYNTDLYGFEESIRPLLNDHDANALVLGTGGASKAIMYGLKRLGINPTLVSRTKRPGVITYEEITPEVMANNTVIVNCTPVGMYPKIDEAPAIPYECLTSWHLCYDLLYNPDETLFLKLAKERGARVKNGLEMLILQAFESWNIWNR